MLATLLKHGSWSDIKELASGRLFRAFPPGAVATLGADLLKARGDGELRRRTRDSVRSALEDAGCSVSMVDDLQGTSPLDGETLLRVYFAQLLGSPTTFLDVRSGTFDGTTWAPGRLIADWDPEFLEAVREMYRSFYDGRDDDFDRAVEALGLAGTADLFRAHFGADQSAVRFELDSFRETFQGILQAANDRGHRLTPSVGRLGIYLLCLYEHMEEIGGGPYDVRTIFQETRTRLDNRQEPT